LSRLHIDRQEPRDDICGLMPARQLAVLGPSTPRVFRIIKTSVPCCICARLFIVSTCWFPKGSMSRHLLESNRRLVRGPSSSAGQGIENNGVSSGPQELTTTAASCNKRSRVRDMELQPLAARSLHCNSSSHFYSWPFIFCIKCCVSLNSSRGLTAMSTLRTIEVAAATVVTSRGETRLAESSKGME